MLTLDSHPKNKLSNRYDIAFQLPMLYSFIAIIISLTMTNMDERHLLRLLSENSNRWRPRIGEPESPCHNGAKMVIFSVVFSISPNPPETRLLDQDCRMWRKAKRSTELYRAIEA